MESAADTIKRIKSAVKRIGVNLDQSERLPRPSSRASSQQRPAEEDYTYSRVSKDEAEELRAALQSERDKNRSLESELENKLQLLQDFNQVDAEMKHNLEQLQEDYESQAHSLAESEKEVASLRKKLETTETALSTMEQRCKDFEELSSEYKQETFRLKQSRETEARGQKEQANLARENEELRQEIKDINSTAELYQEQIAALRSDYQELRQEYLASRDLQTSSASTQEVEEMKSRIQELELVVAAFQKPAELQYDSRSSSPSSMAFAPTNSVAQICESLLVLLKIESYDGILGAVQRLMHHSRVIRRLGDLITSMSPPETYTGSPTSNQVWKWVNRLANDYVAIQEGLSEAKEVLSKLKRAAGVSRAEEVVQRMHSLEKEKQALSHLRDSVVSILGIPTQASVREIKDALSVLKKTKA